MFTIYLKIILSGVEKIFYLWRGTARILTNKFRSLYFQVGLAVVNGLLYAVGGFDGTAYLKTIEVYDSEQNQWKLCGCMNYRRLGGGVGVMRAPQTENYIW